MEEREEMIKQKRIFNGSHNKYLEDYLLENSLDNHPDIQLIFSDNTKVSVSCLSIYLVFPFIENELSNLLVDYISLPEHTLRDFNIALKACFNDKLKDNTKPNKENEVSMDCIESDTSDNKKNDTNLTVNFTEPEITLNQKEFINQNDPAEDVDNNASIIFECQRCSTNLTQETILDHQCQANENKIHNYESEIIEADKIDEVEVIVEYEEDGLEENICYNNLRTTDSAVSYVCDACGEIFKTRTAMLNHLSLGIHVLFISYATIYKDLTGKVYLKVLGSSNCTGKLKNTYNNHIKSTLDHRQQFLPEYDEELNCSYCDKSFRHRSHLVQHQRSHTKEKPFKCNACPRTFSTNGNLKIHKEKHKDFSERKFKCAECEYAATSAVLLKYHMNSHKGVKMFECEHCGASYMRPHSLRKHRKRKCDSNRLSQIPDHKEYDENNKQDVYILPDLIIPRKTNEAPDYGVHSLQLLVDQEDELVDSEIVNDDLNLLIVQTQR